MDLWHSPPDPSDDGVDGVEVVENRRATTVGQRHHVVRHELRVDPSEGHAALIDLARQCDDFDVRMEHLTVGDCCLDRGIVVERKTYADFAISLADGRLFAQAAKLARCPHRPVILLEGPRPARMPDFHPHALKGAMVSLAVMWRLPVLCARDPEDSLRILRFLAHGSDIDARGVFLAVLMDLSHNRHSTEFFLAAQMQPNWFPTVPQVEFVRLTATEAAALIATCGRYWIVSRVERRGDVACLALAQPCDGTLREYVVSFDGGQWRLGPPGTGKDRGWVSGIGSGFVGGRRPECACP